MADLVSLTHAAGSLTSEITLWFCPGDTRTVSHPFLVGFDYSQPDSREELSEPAQLSKDSPYRHQKSALERAGHRSKCSYKIYSLGVILIDALWTLIGLIWRATGNVKSCSRHLRQGVVPLLTHLMGQNC